MKKIIRIISACILSAILLTILASCKIGLNDALVIGDVHISADEYEATAISIKSQFLSENDIEETSDLWDQYIDETYSSTVEEYLNAMVQSYLIEYALYSIHFEELGLELEESVVTEIEDTLSTYIDQYGSEQELDKALREQGFTYENFKNQYYSEAKKEAVIMYYFGPEGVEATVTMDDLLEYYSEYYTKVKHVFLSTKDKDGADLMMDEKAKVGKKANEIYQLAINGADFETLIDEYNEDPSMPSNPNGYIFSTSDKSYVAQFSNAAFDMEPGEIRLIQTNLGFHIIKKYPFTVEELSEPKLKLTLIENMMGTEASNLVDSLKERIGVTYNNNVITNLTVSKIETVKKDDDSSQVDINVITDSLDIELEEDE